MWINPDLVSLYVPSPFSVWMCIMKFNVNFRQKNHPARVTLCGVLTFKSPTPGGFWAKLQDFGQQTQINFWGKCCLVCSWEAIIFIFFHSSGEQFCGACTASLEYCLSRPARRTLFVLSHWFHCARRSWNFSLTTTNSLSSLSFCLLICNTYNLSLTTCLCRRFLFWQLCITS